MVTVVCFCNTNQNQEIRGKEEAGCEGSPLLNVTQFELRFVSNRKETVHIAFFIIVDTC